MTPMMVMMMNAIGLVAKPSTHTHTHIQQPPIRNESWNKYVRAMKLETMALANTNLLHTTRLRWSATSGRERETEPDVEGVWSG